MKLQIIRAALALTAGIAAGIAPSSAFAGGEVNLYTDRQEVFLRPALAAFTRETEVEVNVLFIKAGLRERLRAEGESSPADVVLVADVGALSDIVADQLTRPVPSGLAADLAQVVPQNFRDENGQWFAVTRRARILYAAPDLAPQVHDYADLASPKLRGKICLRSGRHPYNIGLVSHIIASRGEAAAREWLAAVKANLARRPQGNDRAQIKGVLNGECGVAVANSYYFFQTLKNAESDSGRRALLEKVIPVQPPNPNVNITGMALAANPPNLDNAAKLMRFLVGEKAQRIYANQNKEFPVRADAEWPGDLEPYRAKLQNSGTSLKRLAEFRALSSRMVEAAGFDR